MDSESRNRSDPHTTLEPSEPTTTLKAGLMFAARYQIEGRLGSGGSGALFRAFDIVLRRQVALKILHARQEERAATESARRVLREARAAAALNHPNIVAIYDVGEHKGVPFIAMEYVEGRPLRAFVGKSEPGFETRLKWVVDVARALAAAHEKGIVHRDIKPDNVMLRDDGTIKVLDFGIARLMAEHRVEAAEGRAFIADNKIGATEDGATIPDMGTLESSLEGTFQMVRIVGTPGYISPEQVRGDALDARTDQFAWAVMAYELLGGRLPWSGDRHSLLMSVLTEEAKVLTGIPDNVARVIAQALEKPPEHRYTSMHALLSELGQAYTAPAISSQPRVRTGRFSSRARLLSVLGVLTAGAIGGSALHTRGAQLSGQASSASAPTPPTHIGTAVTDLSLSPSCKKEAAAPYRDGLLALQSANWHLAWDNFKKADAVDPTCPEVQLQLVLIGDYFGSLQQQRVQINRALALRGALDERGRTLLDAYATLFLDENGDTLQWARRLDEAASRFPLDAQILYEASVAHRRSAFDIPTLPHILDLVQRATRIDPKYADAWQTQAQLLVYSGRLNEALTMIDKCLEVAPGAADCIGERVRALRPYGPCSAVLTDARRWMAMLPTHFFPRLQFANALASDGAPIEAIETALQEAQGTSNDMGARGAIVYLYYRALAAAFAGDFAAAEKWIEQLREPVQSSSELFDHIRTQAFMTEVFIETGRRDPAVATAEQFFRQKQAWTDGSWATSEYEPLLSGFLLAQGKISLDTWRSSAELWEARAHTHRTKRQLWAFRWALATNGSSSDGQQLAKEAWAHLPDEIPTASISGQPFHYPTLTNMLQGHIALVAAEDAQAVQLLDAAAKGCDALDIPFAHIRGHLWLGQAKERVGDTPGACAAYDYVIQKWGNAKPRSVTAEEAKRRVQALHCKG